MSAGADPEPAGHGATPRSLVLLVMCVGYFLVLLDVTIVNVALPRLGEQLDAGVSDLQWVVDGYAVALASLLLVGGCVGDVHGHRAVVLTGLATFGTASLACGLAPSVGVLVLGRVVQGVGAALLLPGSLAVITAAYPDHREQARAIGVWAAVGSAALPAGPLLGGALVQTMTWRAVFLLNVPIVLLAGVVAARLHLDTHPARRRLDWRGALAGGLFLATAVFAVIDTGRGGWSVPGVTAAVAAVVLLALFVAVERAAADPMLPLALFRSRGFTTANLVAGAMNLGTLGLLFVLTLYLQVVQHRTPLRAGVALLPLFLPLTLLAPFAGRATARIGPRLPVTVGLVVAAVGTGLLARLGPGSTYPTLLPALLAWGTGLGILTPAVVAAALAAVGPSRSGLASGVNNTARQASGAVGIAVYGAVAGVPGHAARFVASVQSLGIATAALFLVAAAVSLAFVADRHHG